MAKLYAVPGDAPVRIANLTPEDAITPVLCLDESVVPGCIFTQGAWIRKDCACPGLIKNQSDILYMFLGTNQDDPYEMDAHVEIQLENDTLKFDHPAFVFIPKDTAYGNMKITDVTGPVLFFEIHETESENRFVPAQAVKPAGTYTNHVVEKYERADGSLPEAPEGFLNLALWIDGAKLKGAPYMESMWFMTTNLTGPPHHTHDFDELICFISTDPDHPEDLGAKITLVMDEDTIIITQSTVVFAPKDFPHAPLLVPEMERPIYHFTGGNGASNPIT